MGRNVVSELAYLPRALEPRKEIDFVPTEPRYLLVWQRRSS